MTLPDGSSQLWILRHGKPSEITVQLGLGDGAYTEIVEGDLQPGDEVIIGEQRLILPKMACTTVRSFRTTNLPKKAASQLKFN